MVCRDSQGNHPTDKIEGALSKRPTQKRAAPFGGKSADLNVQLDMPFLTLPRLQVNPSCQNTFAMAPLNISRGVVSSFRGRASGSYHGESGSGGERGSDDAA